MDKLDRLESSVDDLKVDMAGLKPVVKEIHSQLPRITTALETLAVLAERQRADEDEHGRIHYRISDNEKSVAEVSGRVEKLRGDFDVLHREHIECVTERKVKVEINRASLLARMLDKLEERALELAIGATLLFFAWIIVSHLSVYPPTKAIIEANRRSEDGRSKN